MERASGPRTTNRHVAVVTGANKGIGFGVCKQLASNGVTVVLTSRDGTKGFEAVEKLKKAGLADSVIFHQLDVGDSSSVASLADFIKTQFGKLDILVNNAGIGGVKLSYDALRRATELAGGWPVGDEFNWNEIAPQDYELAEQCLKTNYYGAKSVTGSLLPLLQLSDSPRIVNVSGGLGLLKNIPSERVKAILNEVETLREEKVDEILNEFLRDFREGELSSKGWPTSISAYKLSKAALNAYTRILAREHSNMRINAVAPGYVRTDITGNNGVLSADEGAEFVVRVALAEDGAQSGMLFDQKEALPSF